MTPTPPSPPTQTPTPVPTMSSDRLSDAEKVRKMWTNLDYDFAFSGNPNDILNKIKSFRFDIVIRSLHLYIFLSVHRPIRKNFKRRAVMVPSIYHTVFSDLIEYRNLKSFNKNYSYILVVIDAFSRYAWTRPLKNKEAKSCAEALDDIFSTFKHIPAFFASGKLSYLAQSLIFL